ncbi:hypothetical protein BDY19DRAFT_995482 [Irpex rosettiformis]|uniref:Uncharacterized protein n=1 Tax=Irpex rosettiformis TaxID=378272 RepID=A0ACB8TXC3_9APHY|nr:hypothetical protein BDY19DRAFT_995482 [Irpex rosettiformis]
MSGLSESDIQQLLLEQTGTYIQDSAYVLYLFESCITFSQEIDVIWRRKWSMMTCLYAFTRYSGVLFCINNFIPVWSWEAGQYILDILDITQLFCLALFSALRVYALIDGKILTTGIVFLLNLVPVATNLFNYVTSVIVMDSEVCTSIPMVSESVHLRRMCDSSFRIEISLGTRISVIIGDVLVLLVTWSKSAKLYHEARQLRVKAPLATLLFRDGTFYFIVLLILNMLQVIKANIPSLFTMRVSQPFFENLLPLIVCRFILNLRQVKPAGSSWISGTQSGSLRFVGNAGESLRFGAEEEEENAAERLTEAEEPDVVAQDIIDSGEDIAGYDINFDGSFSARLVLSNTILQGENNGGEDPQE